MGRDEHGTLTRLKAHRTERLEPVLARHGGRLVKLTGDGALVEFPSAVDALGAAIEFQQAMAEANQEQPEDTAIVFRIGLHLGDLIVDSDDLYGDGVNVAARLEAEAPPGGIVISRNVYDAAAGRLKATFEDLGALSLKNIERPVQAFDVKWEAADWRLKGPSAFAAPIASASTTDIPLTLPDKPSIAVLPFQNMSGDPEQEYFVDGLVEDIITALSRFKSLFIIARNSSFTYKGKAVDIKQVGRELGVRYVLEGSVRKGGDRLRITGQLIDSESGAHLWADRIDGTLADVFSLQDTVVEKVIAALVPTVERAEIERARRRPSGCIGAYEHYLKGLSAYQGMTQGRVKEAMSLFKRALELDPEDPSAVAMLLGCYCHLKGFGGAGSAAENDEVSMLVRIAVRVGREDALALAHAAWASAIVLGDLPFANERIERALRLNPNLAVAWGIGAWIKLWSGKASEAIEHLSTAIRHDPLFVTPGRRSTLAHANFFLDRHQEALRWVESQLRETPDLHAMLRVGAASAGLAGMADLAAAFAARLIRLDPAFRVSHLNRYTGPYQSGYSDKYSKGLRMAGLPE